MAILTGTTVQWWLSPRVITIPAPITSANIVDLQDTLQDLEDDVAGMVWPKLRNTSGGEALGGGTSVGLTMELNNAQIAFEARTIVTASGTATTPDTTGVMLIDSAATFITDGVAAGATIINLTDLSVSSVLSVDSETQLTHYALTEGTDNDWDSADSYQVWNEIQCEVGGGNLVSVDTGGNPISAIFPTFGTQVLKTSSSSATSQNAIDIEYASYGGAINIDAVNGDTKLNGATGSVREPFNNLTDAKVEDVSRGFGRLHFFNDYTFVSGDDVDDYDIIGEHITDTVFTFQAGCSTSNVYAAECTLTGVMDGAINAREVLFKDVSGIGCTTNDMVWERCLFEGTLTLRGDNNVQVTFVEGHSNVAGTSTFIFDLNNTVTPLKVSGYIGGFELINKTVAVNSSIDMSGHFVIGATNTAGTLTLRGNGKKTIQTGGTLVDHRHYLSGDEFKNLQGAIEILTPDQTSLGSVWYVDPVNGNNSNVGTDSDRAFKTITYALTQAEDNHGDIILIIAHDVANVEIDEAIIVSKNNISLRGSGHNVHIHPTVPGSDTVLVTGSKVSFANLTIHTAVGGTDDGIVFTGAPDCSLRNIRIEDATGRGLVANAGCDKLQVFSSFVGYSGSHGVEITDCHDVSVYDSHIDTNSGDNIKLNSTLAGDLHEVAFRRTIIHEAGGWGVNIGANCETVQFFDRCKFILNTSGDILDNGITTFVENDSIANATADKVWLKSAALTVGKFLGLSKG